MKTAILSAAAALLIAVTPQTSQAFGLSFVEDLLSGLGVSVDLPEVDIDLPPRAEEALNNALGRAESALDGVFDDIDIDLPNIDIPNIDIPNIDIPDVNIPDVDQIVQDALGRAEAARANARSRAQAAIDNALGRARGVLDDLDIDLPNIDLPSIDLPSINIPQIDLPDLNPVIDDALSDLGDLLDGIDIDLPNIDLPEINLPQINVPDVESIVDDVIDEVEGVLGDLEDVIPPVLEDLLDEGGVLDGIFDEFQDAGVGDFVEDLLGDAPGTIERVLDDVLDIDPLNTVLNNLPEDLIPSSVFTTLETVFDRLDGVMLSQQSAIAVPEPTGASLLVLTAGLGAMRRRRR